MKISAAMAWRKSGKYENNGKHIKNVANDGVALAASR